MSVGGRRGGRSRARDGLCLGVIGAVVLMVAPLLLDAAPAAGVSLHTPTVTASGSFVFGRLPVRPEQTRRVVDTRSGAAPLSLLFWVARDQVASPSTVLTPVTPTPVVPPRPATTAPAPVVAAAPAPAVYNGVLPPMGKAWAWGCAAALQYLTAYAAPDFIITCPGNGNGHEATTTCISGASLCSDGRFISIADPCPAAYMNEASNSWVLIGVWINVPIDPYGQCP
jgi:hypothetical protein